MSEEKRTCAYCGKEKCDCTYRYGKRFSGYRKGFSVRCMNVSAQTTLGELRESMAEWLHGPDDTSMVWSWSITRRGKPNDAPKESGER